MASSEQRATAARLLAEGSSVAAAARAIGIADRSLRRWRQTPEFAALVERAERAIEQTAHDRERTAARRAGLPAPTPPGARREMAEALSPEALARQRALDPRFAPPIPLRLTAEQSSDIAYLRFLRTPESEIDEMLLGQRAIPSRRSFGATRGFTLPPQSGSVRDGLGPSSEPAHLRDPFAGAYGGSDAR